MPIDCLVHIKGNPELESYFKDVKTKVEAMDLAKKYHEKLHNELEQFKQKVLPKYTPKKFEKVDNAEKIEAIKEKYQTKIDEIIAKKNASTQEGIKPTKPIKAEEANPTEIEPNINQQSSIKKEGDGEQGKPKIDLGTKARELAKELREGKKNVLPDFMRAKLSDGTKLSGISANEAFANALETFADIHEATKDFAKAVSEGFKHIKDYFDENKIPYIESELKDNFEKEVSEKKDNVKEPPPKGDTGNKADDSGKLNEKGILNRLFNAKKIPEAVKDAFKKEGLEYETKSQTEAENLAKGIVEEFGIEDAIDMAMSEKFDEDVNSLIFGVSLNKLAELSEQAGKDKDLVKQRGYDEKFAEVGIQYDKKARGKGRFNAAINYFYKKSPLGMILRENAKRKKDFDTWSKPKEQSWKEFFDEMMKDPEFSDVVKEQVNEGMKKERSQARESRKEKVHKIIDDTAKRWAAKLSAKGAQGAKTSGVNSETIFKAVATTMKAAYDIGEPIVKIIDDAIKYVTKELGISNWGEDEFRKEWEEKLKDEKAKKPLTDEELKRKILDKFTNKLKGLTDKQKEAVIAKSYRQIIENGGLDLPEFKKIISDIVGRGELTGAEAARLKELVKKTNAVDDAAKNVLTERTPASIKKFKETELEAGKAARELNELLNNKPEILKRITSIMQLNTLGIPALINNPIYNAWNQSTLRYPVGVINSLVDRVISGIANVTGKKYDREYNTSLSVQKEFFKKLGFGSKESVQQLITGLNREDYFQKEIHAQNIRPQHSLADLIDYAQGKKNLTTAQVIDKALQATVGIPAEAIARTLNLGDKPQRFAAEGAQATAFANALGLKDIDKKIFIEFPREEAYRVFKEQGMSDKEAALKADYVKDVIVKEGKRSTFQQDNILNDVLNAGFDKLFGRGKDDSGAAQLAKSVLVSPYIKIPANAYWSYYNLVNPEVAILQAFYHGGRALAERKNKEENNKSKLQLREARYWMAHAITGMAMRAVVVALVDSGIFIPSNSGDDKKKEREGESFFEQQGTVNLTKLKAFLKGEDASKVKDGYTVGNRWFGQWGTVGNAIARKYEDATPEQREAQDEFWNTILGGMEVDALKDMEQGIFANTTGLLGALVDSGSYGLSRWGVNTVNMFTNIVHPAAMAQISRAQLPYYSTNKADDFLGELKNSFLQRSKLARNLTGKYPPAKVGIWGDNMVHEGNTVQKLFGINKVNKDNFAQPIYEDMKRTGDIGFFPPSVMPKLNGQKLNTAQTSDLERKIGHARKDYVAPYVNGLAEPVPGFNVPYKELSDEDKKYVLHYLYDLGKSDGEDKFIDENPSFKKAEVQKDYLKDAQKEVFRVMSKYSNK